MSSPEESTEALAPAATNSPLENPIGEEAPPVPAVTEIPSLLPANKLPWWRTLAHLVIILAVSLGVLLFRLGVADYKGSTGSNGGQTIQEIVAGNGWILPLRNDRHMPVKPPLYFWMGAATAKMRGTNGDILDSRLPSVFLGTLCVLAVYVFTRSVANDKVALWAALILSTTPQLIEEGRNSRTDMALTSFLTCGLLLLYPVLRGNAGTAAALCGALCLGLAAFSKGPLALGLAVLVCGAAAPFIRPIPGWRTLLRPAPLALVVLIPAAWYAAATYERGWDFLRLHFYVENASRLWGKQGEKPFWFYVEPLITYQLPWTLALPWIIKGSPGIDPRTRRFLWSWVLSMLVFFSISAGKRRAYLLPLRPALAILIAAWLVPQFERWRDQRRMKGAPIGIYAILSLLLLAAIGTTVALSAGVAGFGAGEDWSHFWRAYLQNDLLVVVAGFGLVGVGVFIAIHWLWQRRLELASWAFFFTLVVGLTLGMSAGEIVRGEGASFRPLVQELREKGYADQDFAMFDIDREVDFDDRHLSFLFHFGRHVPVVRPISEHSCEPPKPGLYLVRQSHWDERSCFRDSRWQEVLRGGPRAKSMHQERLVLARFS